MDSQMVMECLRCSEVFRGEPSEDEEEDVEEEPAEDELAVAVTISLTTGGKEFFEMKIREFGGLKFLLRQLKFEPILLVFFSFFSGSLNPKLRCISSRKIRPIFVRGQISESEAGEFPAREIEIERKIKIRKFSKPTSWKFPSFSMSDQVRKHTGLTLMGKGNVFMHDI